MAPAVVSATVNRPWGSYTVLTEGDVNARVWIRIKEVNASLSLMEQMLDQLPQGHVRADVEPAGAPRIRST